MEKDVRKTILDLFREKRNMSGVGEFDNFFEMGVSSLTIIELQIGVEEALGVNVPTSELMRLSTIRGWVEMYRAMSAAAAKT